MAESNENTEPTAAEPAVTVQELTRKLTQTAQPADCENVYLTFKTASRANRKKRLKNYLP